MIAPEAIREYTECAAEIRTAVREGTIPDGYYLILSGDGSGSRLKTIMECQGKNVKCLSDEEDILETLHMDSKRIICAILIGGVSDLPNQYSTIPQIRVL